MGKMDGLGGMGMAKSATTPKKGGVQWDKVVELCSQERFLEAYKQVIAEPEESCLLRLIHILSSPSKEPAANCIDQIFSWLAQALDVGIHFTTSQVEDLAAALQKAAAATSPLQPHDRTEA